MLFEIVRLFLQINSAGCTNLEISRSASTAGALTESLAVNKKQKKDYYGELTHLSIVVSTTIGQAESEFWLAHPSVSVLFTGCGIFID